MNYRRSPILITFYFTFLSTVSWGIQPPSPVNANNPKLIQYIAQNTPPDPIDPLELLNSYDDYMDDGYAANEAKNYEKALESFQKALELKPDDPDALEAIETTRSLMAQVDAQEAQTQEGNSLLTWLFPLLGLGLLGGLGYLWLLNRRGKQPDKFKREKRTKTAPINESNPINQTYTPSFSVEDEEDDHNVWDTSLPVQRTTRIPNPELVDELIRELQNPEPKKRRRAIWKLAQNADSRAMKPLVELMIDTDSYERNLILEALSQISSRTIKPMNQALVLSLQDKNPQVRKNAIRDLTRLYDMMSQVTQLLCHSIDDNDDEVKETAKWALNQLNLQMPPRLDLLLNKDNDSFNSEVMSDKAYEQSEEVDY